MRSEEAIGALNERCQQRKLIVYHKRGISRLDYEDLIRHRKSETGRSGV